MESSEACRRRVWHLKLNGRILQPAIGPSCGIALILEREIMSRVFYPCFKLGLLSLLVMSISSCTQIQKPPAPGESPAPLAAEPIGRIETLPKKYPVHWIVQKGGSFMNQSEGRILIIDPTAETTQEQVKGSLAYANIANFQWSKRRNEFYVGETVYARGTRGERTDVLTIWDTGTLAPVDEVLLPGGKRAQLGSQWYHPILFGDDRFLLMLNFSPATSVNVIDLDKREKVNDIAIPGCVLLYPTGDRGFTSICSNGAMLTTLLDEDGQTVSQTRTEPFFDTNTEPYFTQPVIDAGGRAFFYSYFGDVMEVDLSGSLAVKGDRWSLLTDRDRRGGWRPGGAKSSALDDRGLMYILMHPNGYNGSHKKNNPEVWVIDLERRVRVARYKLKNQAASVFITPSAAPGDPLMIVTSRQNVDVYKARTGKFVRSLNDIHLGGPGLIYN